MTTHFLARERSIQRSGIQMHQVGAIELALKEVSDHKKGIPEWTKNSAGAYFRMSGQSKFKSSPANRIIVLLFRSPRGRRGGAIGCLDLVGMTAEDIELFRNWFDPTAASREDPAAKLWGGHGNGAKSYMVKMFDQSWFATVRDGRYTRMGWQGEDFEIGYIPSKKLAGAAKATAPLEVLDQVLTAAFGTSIGALPSRAQKILSKRPSWTCFVGLDAKEWRKPATLLQLFQHNAQAIRSMEYCSVYAIVDGQQIASGHPLRLERIDPLPGGEEPFEVPVPEVLSDPEGEDVDTTVDGTHPPGTLVLHTSLYPMRYTLKHRHVIRCESTSKGVVGLYDVVDLASTADHIYGEIHLDAVGVYESNFRAEPHDAPLTRAVKAWLRQQVATYARRFQEEARERYTDQARKDLQELNGDMVLFLHQFIDEMDGPGAGGGPGSGTLSGHGRGALPEGEVARIEHNMGDGVHLCGENVTLYTRLEFFDSDRARVRPVAVHWSSSDVTVAYAQLNSVITGQAGRCEIRAIAENGVRSSPINLEVMHVEEIEIVPENDSPLSVGQRRSLPYSVASGGSRHSGVKLNWRSSSEDYVKVGSNVGSITATAAPGSARVSAFALGVESNEVEILTASGGEGGDEPQYPDVRLSEIEEDPDTGEPKHIEPMAGTVVQDIADRRRNIYWVNMRSPIAEQFFRPDSGLNYQSPEFRVYLAERYAEIVFRVPLRKGDQWEPGDVEELLRDRPTQFRRALAKNFSAWLQGEWRPR